MFRFSIPSFERGTAFALLTATIMLAHQVSGKATRDALFLSHYGVEELPKMVMAAAVVSLAGVIVMSRLLASLGPARVIPGAFAASALVFVAIWSFSSRHAGAAAIALYVQMSLFGAILISGFWSLINERFDPHAAKQTVARVAAAATLGGVIGGVLADRVATLLGARSMLIVLALLHVACMFSVRGIGRPLRQFGPVKSRGLVADLRMLFGERYLLWMAALVVSVAMTAALLDYAFKAVASTQFAEREAMVGFFGKFYALVGLLTFAVQSLLGPMMLRRCGIGITLAIMPMVVLAGGVAVLGSARIWSVSLLRGGQTVIFNSFFRSAFELLYTPLAPARKRPTKTIIDVAADRTGDIAGGLVTLAVIALFPVATVNAVILVAMLTACLVVALVLTLHRGYVHQLANSLRDGAISLTEDQILDATTQQTFAETSGSAERVQLLERIKARKRERLGVPEGSATASSATEELPATPAAGERLVNAIRALTSGNVSRVRAFLAGDFMDDRLVPYLVPLLAEDSLAEDVRMELRWIAPRVIGMLTDALLDPDVPLRARQRIPGVLEVTHHPRAAAALVLGLEEDSFNVRYSCARALARLAARDPATDIDPDRVYAAVLRAVSRPPRAWEQLDITLDMDLNIDLENRPSAAAATGYGLDYVFTLLSLVHDRDALQLSLQAVSSSDRNLRGTALEYLENVLPDAVLKGLWPHLGVSEQAPKSARSREVLQSELRRLAAFGRGSTAADGR